MSQEDSRSTPPTTNNDELEKPDDVTPRSGPNNPDLAEEYLKYRQAEREEEQRLERYEQTSSTDTTREKNEDE